MKEERVFIEVTDTRAISSDSHQWMLMKRAVGKEGGFGEWSPYSFSGTFEMNAKNLEDELIRTCGARSFGELSRMAHQIHTMLQETFELAGAFKP